MSIYNPTILVVDDEAAQRETMTAILRRAAYRVLKASDCDDALAIQRQHLGEIDLLIIDLSLPGGSGYNLAKSLLAVEPHLKVLIVSGHAGAELRKFFDAPMTDMHFLEKPFHPEELLQHAKLVMESDDPFAGHTSASQNGT